MRAAAALRPGWTRTSHPSCPWAGTISRAQRVGVDWPFYPAALQPQKPSEDAGAPEQLGGAAPPGRSPETEGRMDGRARSRAGPAPDPRLEELGEQTCPRRWPPVRGSSAPCWTRRAEAARVRPAGQVPHSRPPECREPRNSAAQATPPSDYVRGSGLGRSGATPLGSRAHCALSPDWEWAGPVLSGPQFPRPRQGQTPPPPRAVVPRWARPQSSRKDPEVATSWVIFLSSTLRGSLSHQGPWALT